MKFKGITKNICAFILVAILLVGAAIVGVNAETTNEYEYTVEDGVATITKYNGNSENVILLKLTDIKSSLFHLKHLDRIIAKRLKVWLFRRC